MRPDWQHLEKHRVNGGATTHEENGAPGDRQGHFLINYDSNTELAITARDGNPADPDSAAAQWEHVAVHARDKTAFGTTNVRPPTWAEMQHVKRIFWRDDETVMQVHPAEKDSVGHHRFVLHLWRPKAREIPTPPPLTA